MNAWILPKADVDYLDKILLDEKRNLKVLPHKEYTQILYDHLMLWSIQHAVYVFPTTELISWLQQVIGERKTIEICAGHGSIGRALNITSTDSYIQTTAELNSLYKIMNTPTTAPPKDVYKFEANEAVDVLKPQVVVGGYVTQLYQANDEHGSIYGVNEEIMLPKIETYICIGNEKIHGTKRIVQKYPFQKYQFDWLVCRTKNPEVNAIWVFNNEKG